MINVFIFFLEIVQTAPLELLIDKDLIKDETPPESDLYLQAMMMSGLFQYFLWINIFFSSMTLIRRNVFYPKEERLGRDLKKWALCPRNECPEGKL